MQLYPYTLYTVLSMSLDASKLGFLHDLVYLTV